MAKNKFWKFIKNEATATTPESVELRIDGTIMDDDDAWIYEWLGIPCASPNTFRNALSQYKGKDITVWIDSCGGDVFAAAGMYNALMEHKKTGAKITTKGDSKVMSAATIPYMAGDERLISPLCIFMMHNPLTDASGYASDLRKVADVLDTVKETIINAYQFATGLPRDKISSLMDAETYMDADTAIKEGFADGKLYDDKTEPKNVMNFAFNRLSIQNCASKAFNHLLEIETKKKVEEETIVDSKELKEKYPDIFNEVFAEGKKEGAAEGTKNERERLKAIDELGGKIDNEFLAKAKYEDNMTAEKVAFQAMKEDKFVNTAQLTNMKKDAENANKVDGDAADGTADENVTVLAGVKNIAEKVFGRK